MNSTCLCLSPFTRVRKPTTRTYAAGFFNENVWRRQALSLLLAEPCVKPASRPIGRKILWQLAIKLPSQRRKERWNIWLRIHKLVTAPAQTTCARSSRNDCIFSEKCNKMFWPHDLVECYISDPFNQNFKTSFLIISHENPELKAFKTCHALWSWPGASRLLSCHSLR